MSEIDREKEEAEFQAFLAGHGKLVSAYKDAIRDLNESAPPEVDAAILQQAKAAVAPPPRRRPAWVAPMALAATLLLSLSVLLNIWSTPQTREMMSPDAPMLPPGLVLSEEGLLQASPSELTITQPDLAASDEKGTTSVNPMQDQEEAINQVREPASAPKKESAVAPSPKVNAYGGKSPDVSTSTESEFARLPLPSAVSASPPKKVEAREPDDSIPANSERGAKDEIRSELMYAEEKKQRRRAAEQNDRRQADQGRQEGPRVEEAMRAAASAPPNALPSGSAAASAIHGEAAGASSARLSGAPMSSPAGSVEADLERIRDAMSAGEIDDALRLIDDFQEKFSREKLPQDVLDFERAHRLD